MKRCEQWQKCSVQRQLVTRMGREQNLSPQLAGAPHHSFQICGAGNAFSALRVSTMSGAFSAIIAQS
jgi:hypothetical protein